MDIPFVKLFQTPNCGYFFDVNQNELIPVSDSSFQFLQDLITSGERSKLSTPKELLELKAQGYLSAESVVQEVRHPYSNVLGLFLERKISMITLQLTQNCNFRCKYCPYSQEENPRQRSHSNQRMSWETAKAAVDFLLAHSVDSQRISVGFYGGEPLLEFKLMKRLVKYCQKLFLGKELRFSITSNGTMLNPERIRFLQENKINLMISLDGPKEINNQNRIFANGEGTYDTVIEQIKLVKKIAPEYAEEMRISMVMDPENDFDCFNTIFLDESDIHEMDLQATIVSKEYDAEAVNFSEEFTWKAEYQISLSILAYCGRFPKGEVSPIAKRSLDAFFVEYYRIEKGAHLHPIDAPSGPCVPGQMRLFVDVNGRLFPCERISETSEAICIGTLAEGFYLNKANDLLNVGQITDSICKECWCFRFCIICGKLADNGTSNLCSTVKLSHCEEAKGNAFVQLKQYLLFKELPVFYSGQIRGTGIEGGKDL